ncbi:hypothetical protein Q7C36_014697 [Tachysurus vachellii]|uniref:Uncharacterized protein n=1 Tax=Tachysurus vachellii TaxID=175792 RepID=A0AA88MB25_TACVA|nr:hypothetical protein Q7C36_014697 [Tachysurus vachellii]
MIVSLNSAKPVPFFPEDTGDHSEEPSQGLQSKTDRRKQQVTELPFYCDSESVIIGVSPTQYTSVYLLRDDNTKFPISQLLECSHVELLSASLIRIFYKGCPFLNRKQYTVKLGYTNLNTDTIQTQTCPSSTSGSIHAPAVKCENDNMTVTLAAKELQVARYIDLDASSFQEKVMKKGIGLTQWTDGKKLVVQVEKQMMEVL